MEAIPARLDIGTAEAGGAPDRESSAGAASPTTPQQDKAQAAAEWHAGHPVNIRISVPLLFGRYYLTIVAGRERRSPTRLVTERHKHPLSTFGNLAFLFGLGTVGGLAMLALMQFLSALVLQEIGMVVMP